MKRPSKIYPFVCLLACGLAALPTIAHIRNMWAPYATAGKIPLPEHSTCYVQLLGGGRNARLFAWPLGNTTVFRSQTADSIDYYFFYGPELDTSPPLTALLPARLLCSRSGLTASGNAANAIPASSRFSIPSPNSANSESPSI